MQKNVAGQKWRVFAFDERDNTEKTGEANNISGSVFIDGVENPIDDTNPTEIRNGYYDFNISQAESNGDEIGIIPNCSTPNIQVIGIPGVKVTTPEDYITKINHLDRDISSGCTAGDEMNLVDDAITASKFDETTAFPIVSTDTGDTQIARTGTDGDTLETISDEIADLTISGGASAKQIWEYGERILSAPDNITSDNEKINQAQLNLIQNISGAALIDVDTGVNNIEDKLPSNYIMGSSVQSDKDDDIDLLTSRLSADRATYLDYLSGGAVALESSINQIKGVGWIDENLVTIDNLINNIKDSTDNLPANPASEENVDATETKVDTLLTRLTNARAGFLDYLSGGAVALESSMNQIKGIGWTDENLTTIEGLINDFTAKLPTNYIMGSSVQTDKDDDIDDIKTKTEQIDINRINYLDRAISSGAASGDEMALVDDAITSSKFDESTAFPVKSDDSGNTLIARTGADGDTLETLSDQIDAISGSSAPTVEEIRDGILDDATRFSGSKIDASISSRGTETKQDTMTTHLTDLKGTGFVKATHSNKAIFDRGNIAWITGSGLSGSNTVSIQTQNQSSINIVECAIEVWDVEGTSFYERKSSDTSGQATFSMDDGTYTIKMHKAGYTFDNELLLVNANASVTYTGTEFTPGTPASPSDCRVYEYLKPQSITGFPSSVQATAKIITLPYDSGNYLHAGSIIGGTYNASNGLLYWDIVQGATVEFIIKGYGFQDVKTVPISGSAKLTEIS